MYADVGTAVLAVLLSSTSVAHGQASIYESGPYLSQLSARSVVIRVETENAEELAVVLGAEGGSRRVSDDQPRRGVHSFLLDSLQPKTTYHYKVASSRGGSEEGTFTTAPTDDDVGDVRFILYGDDRGGAGVHQNVVKRMLDEPADFLVNTGDLVADGRIVAQWENFFDIEDKLLRERCLFPAIGNHDLVEESGATFLRYFGTAEQQQKHVFYNTFRWGGLRFFMLNGEGTFLSDDRAWLERELQKADTEPNLAWRIVVIHDGPFASGLHGDNDRLHGAELPKLLRDHHVDFVLEGHDHIYERGSSDGMRYVVSGGAGAPLYPIKHLRTTARKVESTYHYVLFSFGREKGKLTAMRVDGSVLEQVGFSKTSFWDDDLPTAPGITAPASSANASPLSGGPAMTPEEERKQSSSGVPYAVGGLVLIAGVWFWVTRRRRR